MRYMLRGFTLWVNGQDYGYEIETGECVMPDQQFIETDYGGTVLQSEAPLFKVGRLNPKFKLVGNNPALAKLLVRKPGQVDSFTFRGALVDEIDGAVRASVFHYEGQLGMPENDSWSPAEKAGVGYTIKAVRYMRHELGDELIHEIGLIPRKLVVNRVDLLSDYNQALGR